MKLRGILLVATGMLAGVSATATLFSNSPRACPAIGYAYVGDVELFFSAAPETVEVCFGEGCTPELVARNSEGKWLVPQSVPYLNEPVSVSMIHVEAVTASGGRVANDFPIETESTGEYPYGFGCGGPYVFKPVQVALS
jgi:hypothetical protein